MLDMLIVSPPRTSQFVAVHPNGEPGASIRERPPYSPRRLVSLWDMLRFNAQSFIRLMDLTQQLSDFIDRCTKSSNLPITEASETILGTLGKLDESCNDIQLPISIQKSDQIKNLVAAKNWSAVSDALRGLREMIGFELKSKTFVYIPSERTKYFDISSPPFGISVHNRFPALATDIEHASLCLGCGLPTAAVCHLMRIMEDGVRDIATKLVVLPPLSGTEPWGAVLDRINQRIAVLPTTTAVEREEKNDASERAVYLKHVKDAWRNPTMHPDRLYTPEEAEGIFVAVKNFMQQLAK